MSKYLQSFLEVPSGAKLRVFTCKPKGKPKAVIQINHGMSEHAARYERFAKFLAQNGYATIAHDHRGHGETTAPDAPLGSFGKSNGWTKVLSDVDAINDYARKTFPDTPICIFGHSMGATVSASYILNHPEKTDAAAIWNGSMTGFLPNLLANLLKIERMLKGSDVTSTWADALTFKAWNKEFKPVRTDVDWLSRDPDEVDKYVADPLCGFPVTTGLWLDLLSGMNDLANIEKINSLKKAMPVHLQGGSVDPCSSKGKAVTQFGNRLKQSGLTDVTQTILPDTRHESLNEINREKTIEDFVNWLDERFVRP